MAIGAAERPIQRRPSSSFASRCGASRAGSQEAAALLDQWAIATLWRLGRLSCRGACLGDVVVVLVLLLFCCCCCVAVGVVVVLLWLLMLLLWSMLLAVLGRGAKYSD
jgi:hypothetical protein